LIEEMFLNCFPISFMDKCLISSYLLCIWHYGIAKRIIDIMSISLQQDGSNPVIPPSCPSLGLIKKILIRRGAYSSPLPFGLRSLFISGRPIDEPVAWYGPNVMNTEEQLHTAFEAYRKGTFIKHK